MGFIKNLLNRNAEFLEWQNVLLSEPQNKLIMNKSQLVESTIQQVSIHIKRFDDCSKIINETVKPDVFFSRLEIAEESLRLLKRLEPFFIYVDKIKTEVQISELLEKFKREKQSYIESFLVRSTNETMIKALGMKTEKGKKNQYKKLYDSLLPYFNMMNSDNIKYIESEIKSYKNS